MKFKIKKYKTHYMKLDKINNKILLTRNLNQNSYKIQ